MIQITSSSPKVSSPWALTSPLSIQLLVSENNGVLPDSWLVDNNKFSSRSYDTSVKWKGIKWGTKKRGRKEGREGRSGRRREGGRKAAVSLYTHYFISDIQLKCTIPNQSCTITQIHSVSFAVHNCITANYS